MAPQCLVVTAGLPGSGKSTIADGLGRATNTPVFSVDPIEAAMWVSGVDRDSTGIAAYRVAAAVASENLELGLSAIVDAVNPVEQARAIWTELATARGVYLRFIECICSDENVHRARIRKRVRNIPGMPEVTWQHVQERKAEYAPWVQDRLVLDTTLEPPDALIEIARLYCCVRS